MRIYSLTPIGKQIANSPTSNTNPAWRVLYFLRRHGGRATDEQITTFTGMNSATMHIVMNKLVNAKAVSVIS